MMLQYSEVQPIFIAPSEDDPANAGTLDITNVFNHVNNGICDIPDSSSNTSKSSSSSVTFSKNIYVCTFCQVFSPLFNVVSEHIASSHSEFLPSETSPDNFVSRLEALHANAGKKRGKVGRPRKKREICLETLVLKQPPSEPVPRPDGLFWCKKCLRNFRKPRQLTQHICLQLEEQDSDLDGSPIPSEDEEFRTCIDVDPVPWSRVDRRANSKTMPCIDVSFETMDCISNVESNKIIENRVVPNWREDPAYVPLFCDESEKVAFEEHLKSIDLSYVDELFQKEEKQCRSSKKGKCASVQYAVYSCNICKRVLKSVSHVRLHCLTHTDFKPFTCPKCTYSTNSKGSLYIHMRKHTGNMFCCSFCGFKCIKRSHLLEHEATHSSVSQFCKLCRNSYKTLKSLVVHVKKYHNNPGGRKYIKFLTGKQSKEFICNICNKKFKSSKILDKHSQVCHNSDFIPTGKVVNLEESLTDQNLENLDSVIQSSECLDSIMQNSANLDCIIQNSDNLDNVMQNPECLGSIMQNSKNLDCIIQNSENMDNVIQNSECLDNVMQNSECLDNVMQNSECLGSIMQNSENLDIIMQNSENLDIIIQNSENLDCIMQNSENLDSVMQINKSSSLEQLMENVQCNVVLSKDPLVEMVLNNFLQQGQSQSIMYENVLSSAGNLLENFPARRMSRLPSESSIIEECQKTLDFVILNECLQSTDFSDECNQEFDLQPSGCSLRSNSKSTSENSSHLRQISEDKSEESKPVEVKLFEKCRRAPAYVCCVCSAIYICSSTLKAHLKEHVNITSSTLMDQPEEQFEPSRMIETTSDLENVCEMLQASSAETCSSDEELEKLYTSSLDKIWYLPELSIVLQHDPALFDSALDDISNFPMTD